MSLLLGDRVIRIYMGGGPFGDGTYWIDDLGTWHRADAKPNPDAPQSLFDSASADTEDERRFLLDHLGMARVAVRSSPRTLDITWNLRAVEADMLHAVLDYLDAMRTGATVFLRYFADGWHSEIYADEHAALWRIEALLAVRNAGSTGSAFGLGPAPLRPRVEPRRHRARESRADCRM